MDDITKQKGGDVSCILSPFYLFIYLFIYLLSRCPFLGDM